MGVIIRLKALRFELDYISKRDALLDASMLAYIDISQLIVMRSTRNQYYRDDGKLKETSLPNLTAPEFTTSNFESFMDNYRSVVSSVDGIHGVPIDYPLIDVDGNCNYN